MSFRAFVVGADYHLQFARADAEQIAAALENLGYELPDPRIPPPEEDKKSVLERLEQFATACGPEDTLLFYFAGHGVIEQGLFFLVLDQYLPGRTMESCLMMNYVSGIIQGSKAGTKLMILDCCHSGKSFSLADFKFSDGYAILAASEAFQKAFEFKGKKSGFLSYHLNNAFSEDLGKVAKGSRLTLNALQEYLQDKVNEHNSSQPERVPNIIAVSKQWKQLVVAENLEELLIEPVFGLQRINPAFLAAEQCKTGPNFTPAHFYRATPDVQWWGVANDLLSEQSLFPEVLAHVRRAVNGSAPLIGLLFGSGGMGKSILLRRLGAALFEEFAVWWVDSAEDVLQDRAAAEEKLLESDKPPLVLLDDWTMALQDDERKDFQAWFGQLYRSGAGRQIKFILTARNWNSGELPAKLLQDGGSSRFDLDKRSRLEQDNLLLLDKAAEKLADSAWTVAAQELHSSNLARTKPFHLLFVLMREKQVLAGQNVEGVFEEIIQSDLDKLWQDNYKKGLAAAVSTLAFLHVKFRPYLSRKALRKLAERHNEGKPLAPSAELTEPLNYYLYSYRNRTNKLEDAEEYISFLTDEFAEKWSQTDELQHHHAENCWLADAEFLIQEADVYSSSMLLYRICCDMPEEWPAAQKKAMISAQLERGNSHHAYARLLIEQDIFTNEAERWELIEQYISIAPQNSQIAVVFLKGEKKFSTEIIKNFAKRVLEEESRHNYQIICASLSILDKDEANYFAKNLLSRDGQSNEVICASLSILDKDEANYFAKNIINKTCHTDVTCTCLKLLGKDEAKPFAKKLLEEDGQDAGVICTALNLLDANEARPFARKLLEQKGQHIAIIYTALKILDKEAETFALRVLDQWQQQPFDLLLRCLKIAPTSRQAEAAIPFLLERKMKQSNRLKICVFPFHAVPAWREETQHILSTWNCTKRQVVATVLRHYLDDPFLLNKSCFEILHQWEYEIECYRKKKKYLKNIYTDHILIALGHPHLRTVAARTADRMLLHEKEQPGFLGEKLLQAAEAIVNEGIYPDWEKEAD
uniref:caspase family protein n=1 Tax=Candidatus Electronema sp. TaxID=2698783 RepID=UPI0040577136